MDNPQLQPIFNLIQSKKRTPLEQLATLRQAQEQLGMQGIQEQRQGLEETQARIEQMKQSMPDQKQQQITRALLAAGDMLSNSGGKASQLYQMFQPPGQQKALSEAEKLLAQQRMNLSKSELGLLDQQLTGSFRDATLAQNKELAQQKIAADLAKARGTKGKDLTPFQKKRDEAFGKIAAEWDDAGGFSKVAGNLKALREVSTKLAEPGDLTNTFLPTAYRKYAPGFLGGNTESVQAQQQVEFVVQQSLKQILGGQFSKEEGKQLIQRSYDPALSDEQNKKKLDGLIERLETMAEAKQGAIDWAKEHGTLDGYPGFKGKGGISGYMEQMGNDLKKDFGGSTKTEPTRPVYKNPRANSLAEEFGL